MPMLASIVAPPGMLLLLLLLVDMNWSGACTVLAPTPAPNAHAGCIQKAPAAELLGGATAHTPAGGATRALYSSPSPPPPSSGSAARRRP